MSLNELSHSRRLDTFHRSAFGMEGDYPAFNMVETFAYVVPITVHMHEMHNANWTPCAKEDAKSFIVFKFLWREKRFLLSGVFADYTSAQQSARKEDRRLRLCMADDIVRGA